MNRLSLSVSDKILLQHIETLKVDLKNTRLKYKKVTATQSTIQTKLSTNVAIAAPSKGVTNMP